jgi:hypothetical protein
MKVLPSSQIASKPNFPKREYVNRWCFSHFYQVRFFCASTQSHKAASTQVVNETMSWTHISHLLASLRHEQITFNRPTHQPIHSILKPTNISLSTITTTSTASIHHHHINTIISTSAHQHLKTSSSWYGQDVCFSWRFSSVTRGYNRKNAKLEFTSELKRLKLLLKSFGKIWKLPLVSSSLYSHRFDCVFRLWTQQNQSNKTFSTVKTQIRSFKSLLYLLQITQS